jgi:hypothetical protein
MTMLMFPSMQDKLLRVVSDEVSELPVREWDEHALETCLTLFRQMHERVGEMRAALETELAGGVEARSFLQAVNADQRPAEEVMARVHSLIDQLSAFDDPGSKKLAAAARLLEQGSRAYYGLLSEAIARCLESARPVDAERWQASEEAYDRGAVKPFSRK